MDLRVTSDKQTMQYCIVVISVLTNTFSNNLQIQSSINDDDIFYQNYSSSIRYDIL